MNVKDSKVRKCFPTLANLLWWKRTNNKILCTKSVNFIFMNKSLLTYGCYVRNSCVDIFKRTELCSHKKK